MVKACINYLDKSKVYWNIKIFETGIYWFMFDNEKQAWTEENFKGNSYISNDTTYLIDLNDYEVITKEELEQRLFTYELNK